MARQPKTPDEEGNLAGEKKRKAKRANGEGSLYFDEGAGFWACLRMTPRTNPRARPCAFGRANVESQSMNCLGEARPIGFRGHSARRSCCAHTEVERPKERLQERSC